MPCGSRTTASTTSTTSLPRLVPWQLWPGVEDASLTGWCRSTCGRGQGLPRERLRGVERGGAVLRADDRRIRSAAGEPRAAGLHRPGGVLGAPVNGRRSAVSRLAYLARAEADIARRQGTVRGGADVFRPAGHAPRRHQHQAAGRNPAEPRTAAPLTRQRTRCWPRHAVIRTRTFGEEVKCKLCFRPKLLSETDRLRERTKAFSLGAETFRRRDRRHGTSSTPGDPPGSHHGVGGPRQRRA
jgi:hypothetical protein